jgi:hypothetical protein
VLWNVVPEDWIDPERWVERALEGVRHQPESLVVLHDIIGPAVGKLDRFLDLLADGGFEVVQRFPSSCVPIREGSIVASVTPIVADGR